MNENGNSCGWEWIILLLFFCGFGGGMWGMGGLNGGAGALGASSLVATETSALIGQDNLRATAANTNATVAGIAADVRANGAKVETVKDAVTNGFYATQTQFCELGNNLNNAIRDNREASAREFCELRHQQQVDKCDILRAVADSQAAVIARMQQAELDALKAQNLELKGQLSQDNQTARLIAALGQRPCAPCAPCAPCNPCYDGVQRAVNDALGTRIGELLFPTTTSTTA